MTHLTLSGLIFESTSPSSFKLVGRELYIDYTGAGWVLNGADETGEVWYEVPSRDQGARMLAEAMREVS